MERICKKHITAILIITALLCPLTAGSQDHPLNIISGTENLELIHPGELPEEEMQAWTERLQELASHPIDINSDKVAELQEFGLISEFQLNKLKEYRFRYGPLLSWNELMYIEGWGYKACQRVIPFLAPMDAPPDQPVKKKQKRAVKQVLILYSGRLLQSGRGYLVKDTAENEGNPHYAGSPWKASLRYDMKLGTRVSLGIRAEKDPGEKIMPYHDEYPVQFNYPDYLSGYILLTFSKFIKKICLGDYHLRFGRGITLCSQGGYTTWKDPFNQGMAKTLLRQNTSMSEQGYFRGAAVELSVANLTGCIFYSMVKADPSGYEMSENGRETFTSVSTSGYHRTESELTKRGKLDETTYGGMLVYRGRKVRAGIVACASHFSMMKVTQDQAYDMYDFSGAFNFSLGGYLEGTFNRSNAYGEFSFSHNKKLAFLAGWQSILSSTIKISIDIRHFPVTFQPAFHAGGAGPYGSNSNESGLLAGMELGLPKYWTLAMTCDYARKPWLSYGNNFSANRYAFHIRGTKDARDYHFMVGYTYRQVDEALKSTLQYTPVTVRNNKHQADAQLNILRDDILRYKSRFSFVIIGDGDDDPSRGSIMQQEITYCWTEAGLRVSLGGILFHTDDYSSRCYVYEPSVLYASGSQALYDRGVRSYFLVRWSPLRAIDLWVKAGVTVYKDRLSVGSGWDEIEGNKKASLQAQLRVRM